MPFYSISDPDFWKIAPPELAHMREGRGTGGVAYFPMGNEKGNPPTVVALKMAPDWVLPRHCHNCYRFEIVVQGTLDVGDRILNVGDVMVSEPNVVYGPHVAGPEGCTTFEIFSNFAASFHPVLDIGGSLVEFDVSTREGLQRMRDAQTRQPAIPRA